MASREQAALQSTPSPTLPPPSLFDIGELCVSVEKMSRSERKVRVEPSGVLKIAPARGLGLDCVSRVGQLRYHGRDSELCVSGV